MIPDPEIAIHNYGKMLTENQAILEAPLV